MEKIETAVAEPLRNTLERERLLAELNKAKTPWKMLRLLRRLKKLPCSEVYETPEGR